MSELDEQIGRLCEWPEPVFERTEPSFTASWRIPVSRRGDPDAGA